VTTLSIILTTLPPYLPALGASVFRLRDSICDALFTKRCTNFRVICDNKLISIGPDLSDDAAKVISRMWGTDPVHPSPAAYEALACAIERDVLTDDVKYINAPKSHGGTAAKPISASLGKAG
jgi:lysophospholipase L1-like esterase